MDHVKGEYNRLEAELVKHIQQSQFNNSQDQQTLAILQRRAHNLQAQNTRILQDNERLKQELDAQRSQNDTLKEHYSKLRGEREHIYLQALRVKSANRLDSFTRAPTVQEILEA